MKLLRFITRLVGLGIILTVVVVGCQSLRNSGRPALGAKPENALRLATFNVHYIVMNEMEGSWSVGHWAQRKGPLDGAFKAIKADIIAFQEMESFAGGDDDSVNFARSWLLANNPEYASAAICYWRDFPTTQPIFYRRNRFEVMDQGWFFCSETPDVIYSPIFDGSYPAFASWTQFQDQESGKAFRIVNVHLDYSSRENRRRSTELVAQRIAPWIAAGETVFMAGDLNARLGSPLHRTLEATGLDFVPVRGATYQFNFGLNLFGAIDHIGHAGDAKLVGAPVAVRDSFGAVWPTDHYPLVADFRFAPEPMVR